MDDLVERLRDSALHRADDLYEEAAAEIERLRAALEKAASIAFNGVEEEGYPGSIDRRPETLRNAILALV